MELLRNLQAAGQEVQALINRPVLTRWAAPYYRAFMTLSDSRPVGFGGLAKIPLSEIVAYLSMMEVDDVDERERYVTMIRALDIEFLAWVAAKKKTQPSENGRPHTPPGASGSRPRGRLTGRRG